MRTIERSTAFKRDFKRLAKGPFRAALLDDLPAIIEKLMIDEALDPSTETTSLSLHGQAFANAMSNQTCS